VGLISRTGPAQAVSTRRGTTSGTATGSSKTFLVARKRIVVYPFISLTKWKEIAMNKMLSVWTAGMMVLAMNGFAVAQDAASQPNTQQSAKPATEQQDTQAKPADQSGDIAKQDTQAQPADQSGDVAKKDTQAQPADQSGDVAKKDTQAQPADQSGDVAKQDTQAQPADQAGNSAKEQEYSAALKKCETLSSSEKAKCTEAAKKKHGEM